MSDKNPVKALNPEVARKIAAGEVIDRPNAIVRELMDNAIDSGATSITVEITGGGIEKIRIIDNGCGLTKEDLQNCARPHATSKISTETDLMNLSTLGFRGEALASIAAVARLSIISGGWKMRASITEDHILEPVAQTKGAIVQSEGLFENFPARRQFLKRPATEGVMCKSTFIEKALSRPDIAFRLIMDGETKIDLPENQSLKDRFIMANGYTESSNLFYELQNSSSKEKPDWSFTIVIGEPGISRNSKKDIVIYTNGRKIQEYSLVQAIEYGGQGFFPNGTYPVAAAFIQVNPGLVDFNIHPAKKEARFYDISDLHHGISTTVKAFFKNYTYSNFENNRSADDVQEFDFSAPKESFSYEKHLTYKTPDTHTQNFSDYRSRYLSGHSEKADAESQGTVLTDSKVKQLNLTPSYLSSSYQETASLAEAALKSFDQLADAEKNNSGSTYNGQNSNKKFSISDKPGANNAYGSSGRLSTNDGLGTYERLNENNSPFSTPAPEKKSSLKYIGCTLGTFILVEKENCLFIVDQHAAHERILFDRIMSTQGKRQPLLIPYKLRTESKTQDNLLEKLKDRLSFIGFETVKVQNSYWEVRSIPERWTGTETDLKTLIFVKHVEPDDIIRAIAAMTACHAAVKDGYVLDDETAAKLAEQAFMLKDPHCPHGRPIYTVISREKLFELVKRT